MNIICCGSQEVVICAKSIIHKVQYGGCCGGCVRATHTQYAVANILLESCQIPIAAVDRTRRVIPSRTHKFLDETTRARACLFGSCSSCKGVFLDSDVSLSLLCCNYGRGWADTLVIIARDCKFVVLLVKSRHIS